MKRLLLSLACILECASTFGTDYYFPDVYKTVTVQFGQSVYLDPLADAGIDPSLVKGSSGTSEVHYETTSNGNELSITENTLKYQLYSNQQAYYYWSYDVRPLKTGSFVITTYNYYKSTNMTTSYVLTNRVVYTLNVVEVTKINIPSSLVVGIGEKYTFEPQILTVGATTTLTWQSSNPSVATVDANGTLSAIGIGTTTISCTAQNGVTASCELTVNPVEVSSLIIDKPSAELTTGEQLQLTANIQPSNASNKSLTWSSSNETVAVVNESGLVTAVGSGMCNITAATKDGSELTASCLVTVLGNVLYCEDFGAVQGAIVTIPIQLKNADAIQGFEFELVLPEGVSVEADENGKLKAALTDRVSTTGLDGAQLSNGNYKFVFTSTNRLLGNEGAVVNVPIVVAEGVAIGTYDVVVKNVELVKYGTSAQIHHADRTATLTVNAMTLGDVNGDGRISVADAISIINYALGRTPVSFVTRAADVNGDGDISLADAVAVVDIILGRNGSNVKAAELLPMSEPE